MPNIVQSLVTLDDSASITLLGTGTDRLIMVIPMSTSGSTNLPTGVTLNGVSGTLSNAISYDGGATVNAGIATWLDSQHMGAGTFTLESTWAAAVNDIGYLVIEWENFDQTTPLGTAAINTIFDQAAPYDLGVNLTGESGKAALVVGLLADGSTGSASGFITSNDGLTLIEDELNSNLRIGAYLVESVASGDETYTLKYSSKGDATVLDTLVALAIPLNTLAPEPNLQASPTLVEATTATPVLTIDGLSAGPYYEGDTVTIQLSNADNATGKTLSCPAGAITVTAQDSNSISFSVFDLKIFGTKTLNYNENIPITVTDAGESDSVNLQITPTVGSDFAEITAVEGIYTDDVTVAVGDYGYGTFMTGTGAVDLATGNFSPDVHSTYKYWVKDTTDGVWSDSATEVFQDPTGTYVTVTTPIDETDGSVFYGHIGIDPINGDHIIHEPVTSPSGIAVSVSSTGIWQLASMPSTTETFDAYVLHVNNTYSNKATFTFTAPDVTAPTLTLPTDISTGETTGSGTVTTDDATGTLYYLATTNPTENATTIKTGDSQAVSTTGVQNVLFTGLTGSTTYYAHFVHTDVYGNNSNVSNANGFLTDAAPDTTAPILSVATGDRTGQTTAAGSVTTDEAGGTLYYVITQNSSEVAATVLTGSQQSVTATGIQNVTFSGLTPGAGYYIHYLQVDASANESSVVSSAQFTTDSAIALVISSTTDIHLGASFTITTTGAYDLLAAASITATLGGLSLTGLANVTATTCDFTCPATGLSLVSPSDLILTIDI